MPGLTCDPSRARRCASHLLMDVLAEASVAALTKESDAAAILQTLFERRDMPCTFVADDTEPAMASPTSEENMDIQAPPQPWARSEDEGRLTDM
jgi:hypothetical protein